MPDLRAFLLKTIPAPLLRPLRSLRDSQRRKVLAKAANRAELFSAIYTRNMWGGASEDFYSGHGSHYPDVVQPYVDAVIELLRAIPGPPNVCDLGCGDFAVGSQIRPHAGGYIAADIVPELVARNAARFPDTEFRVIDLVADDLPDADIVFIRQVLQHLSNDDIASALPKLAKFPRIVITEDVPTTDFVPNADKLAGFDVRLASSSGVDITAPPFNFPVKVSRVICEVAYGTAWLRTTYYEPA